MVGVAGSACEDVCRVGAWFCLVDWLKITHQSLQRDFQRLQRNLQRFPKIVRQG